MVYDVKAVRPGMDELPDTQPIRLVGSSRLRPAAQRPGAGSSP